MKQLLTLFLAIVFASGAAFAQETFQGTLQYDFKFTGEGVEQAQAMLPTGMEIQVRKTDMLMEMQGGMMAMMMGKILVLGKKGKSYMIKDSEETIYVMDPAKMKEDDDGDTPEPTITKEDETVTIAGYECQKYKVTMETSQGEMTQQVWVTDKIALPKGSGGGAGGGLTSGLTMKGLPGLPLKTMVNQGPITVIMTAKKVDATVPDKKAFKLPKGYDKEEFDMNSMMGGMGGM